MQRQSRHYSTARSSYASALSSQWSSLLKQQHILPFISLLVFVGVRALIARLSENPAAVSTERSLPLYSAIVTTAHAYDLNCASYWSGPSADNDVVECLKEFVQKDFGMLVPPLIPAILTALLLLGFPLVFICRVLGACGSNEARPGADCCCDGEEWDAIDDEVKLTLYPRRYVKQTKRLAFFAMLFSFIGVALIGYGSFTALDSFDVMIKSVRVEIFEWSKTMLDTVDASTRAADGSYIAPITAETFVPFHDLYDWADEMFVDVQNGRDKYGQAIVIVAVIASIIPALGMIAILIMAFCNIRRILPRLCQFVFYFIGVLCGLVGLVLLAAGVAGYILCGEGMLQLWQAPGVFQWWVVPECDSQSIFGDAVPMLRAMETDNSRDACTAAMSICNEDTVYDPIGNPNAIFVCPLRTETTTSSGSNTTTTTTNVAEYCSSFDGMNSTLMGMTFKAGSDALCPPLHCRTFADCAEYCTDEALRNSTRDTLVSLQFAENATLIIDKYVPELDCDVIVTRFTSPLTLDPDCTDFSFGLLAMGIGASLATLVFIWGIILLFKGQKLFFNRRQLIGDEVIEIEVMPENDYWAKRSKGKPPGRY